MKIIDSHSHMFTENIARAMKLDMQRSLLKDACKCSVNENIKAWLSAMDQNNIEKTVFMATQSLHQDFIDFIGATDRFVGIAKINPTLPEATETLKKEISLGMKGVKLYATNDGFDVGSKKAYPFYEYCQSNKIPIVIHFGITIGHASNLMMGNPLLLSNILKEFPNLNIVVAHFGAGFFRELLMLNYKCNNLYVDTSGTNNWLECQDNFLTLKDVFKKTLSVFGPQRIIFGTDTRIFPDGYRQNVLQQQIDILNQLHISGADQENIMYYNAKSVFSI